MWTWTARAAHPSKNEPHPPHTGRLCGPVAVLHGNSGGGDAARRVPALCAPRRCLAGALHTHADVALDGRRAAGRHAPQRVQRAW
eukprot:186350-Chlamydomonas_euryale.AAC.1